MSTLKQVYYLRRECMFANKVEQALKTYESTYYMYPDNDKLADKISILYMKLQTSIDRIEDMLLDVFDEDISCYRARQLAVGARPKIIAACNLYFDERDA